MRHNLLLGVAAVALMAPVAASAQETTSSIRGTVTSEGAPVAGAEVTVVNVPSGSRSTATTDQTGSFNVTGLRVGGPYSVSVTSPSGNATVSDIFTDVGQAFDVPIALNNSAGAEVVVTASSISRAGSVSQGPATVLTTAQIANIATTNRDIRDLARRDPFARLDDTPGGGRAVSFAGQNARFNKFSVDGVPVTDNFGLNPDGLPSRRSPIPLDAIGQFQTKVAPYDVREGNFQGGAINIILRSGTNAFQGTAFYSLTNDSLTGKKTKPGNGVPTGVVTLPKFKSQDYGIELSGPIIKDKLFFMVAGERIRAGTPIPEGPIDNNAGTAISGISQAQVDQVVAIAKSKYGYDAGGVLNNSNDMDDRLVAKLDANLSDTQRASFTYSYTKDSIQFNQNTFTTAPPGLGLSSDGYISSNRLHTGVFQLNSDWSDDFSTEARAFLKDYKRGQDPIMGRGFAQMQICDAALSDRLVNAAGAPVAPGTPGALVNTTTASASISCASGASTITIGPDISRQTNALTSRTWGGSLAGRLHRDDHDLKFFTDFSTTSIFNAFLQRSAGDYYFDSIADFQAGNAQRLRYGNAIPTLNPNDAAANFSYQSYAFGIQDSWRVSDTFNVSYGMRYDLYGGKSRAALNPNFVSRYGFTNNAYISGRGVFQPRIGFDFKPINNLSVRGGVGIFAGGSPDVYISNSFSNTGILTNSIDVRQVNDNSYTGATAAQGAAILTAVSGTALNAAANTVLLNGTVASTSSTNALDPNFKLPSQWRSTLSTDYRMDLGGLGKWNFGVDLFYSRVRNQVLFTDLRVVKNGLLTPDGRPRYSPVTTFTDTNSDIFLTNTNKGRSYVGVLRADARWSFGLTAGASFTYQNVKDQAPATSSTASSNYANGAFEDPNVVQFGTANDEVKYNIKYNLTFDHAFFGDYKTTFALFGETRIGHPYSFTFLDAATRSTVFGTIGSGSRYLLYVPTFGTDAKVSYASATDQAAIEGYFQSIGLGKYQGKVAPRNAFHSAWFTRLDLHLAQEIPAFIGKSRVTVFADIDNFTNLINKNWGQILEYAFPYNVSPVRVTCLTTAVPTGTAATGAQTATTSTQTCAQYRYTPATTSAGAFVAPTDTIYARQSLYSIRVGVKFSF
ncbi:MAG: TonB-dependent receptor [Sphingomonas bacterium]|uniref:TonB-dependent receptor n=1 Tax=Sphingomonas bacterium TaxID=1895847 RepID=UPI00261F719B|nr:carboxypeptidase regulatory-like domain-containing protein [Sphingomonas bacterium]MDB5708715.1 TonB-dependent receptor [Sphingomonas bacterium]